MTTLLNLLDVFALALHRRGGVLVAVAAVGIIALLIVPVPAPLLDVLLGFNISVAVAILLVALWVPNASSFSSFPTVLLLTTLFRLALNICSTRLVLSEAEAGVVIDTFGRLTVAGNYVLGGVIFLIITVVQFVVISKGAERVSEVSARFTLDAMAGKQMAIDADLRGGLIQPDQARTRRSALDRESKLYGALEGAMKFVKGDAIAGIVISAINIVAGLILGITQMGMSAAEAAETFTLLTIGDGLVSQVPALLITCAAGLIVTRVSVDGESDGAPQPAGGDIVAQVCALPGALVVAGLTLIPLSLLFGIGPQLVGFVATAILCLTVALPQMPFIRAHFSDNEKRSLAATTPPMERDLDRPTEPKFAPHPEPVVLELGRDLYKLLAPTDAPRAAAIAAEFESLRSRLEHELAVELPRILFARSAQASSDAYRIALFDCRAAHGRIAPDQVMVLADAGELGTLGLAAQVAPVPVFGNRAALIAAVDAAAATEAGFTCLGPLEVVLEHCCSVLRRNAAEFCGAQEVQRRLVQLEQTHPDLVEAVVPRLLTLSQLTLVLQRLLREAVPLRDMRTILGALAQHAQTQKHPLDLAEAVRRALRHAIVQRAARHGAELGYYRLAPDIEDLVHSVRTVEQADAHVGLAPDSRRAILDAVANAVCQPFESGLSLAIVTRPEVRPFVRALLESRLPDLHILSELEVAGVPAIELKFRGVIAMQ